MSFQDKRVGRKLHREEFQAGISRFREKGLDALQLYSSTPSSAPVLMRKGLYCRVRPISEREINEQFDFEAVTCHHERDSLFIHKCSLAPDLTRNDAERFAERKWLHHYQFNCFDRVFGPGFDTDAVYEGIVKGRWSAAAGSDDWTLLMFGQTGSGKSHTINGIINCLLRDLFQPPPSSPITNLKLAFIQVQGTECVDLASLEPIQILDTENQSVHLKGLSFSENLDSFSDALAYIQERLKIRSTRATFVNSTSSRSHLFIIFEFDSCNSSGRKRISLVDLAGSERNADTFNHNSEQIRESQAINSSISALKECLRRHSLGQKPVFRQSLLTRLLKPAFSGALGESLDILFTVSPGSTDTEHSLTTLQYAQIIATGSDPAEPACHTEDLGTYVFRWERSTTLSTTSSFSSNAMPIRWTPEQVQDWISNYASLDIQIPSGTDGKKLMRMAEKRWIQLCGEANGRRIFSDLKKENDRIRKLQDLQRTTRLQVAEAIRTRKT